MAIYNPHRQFPAIQIVASVLKYSFLVLVTFATLFAIGEDEETVEDRLVSFAKVCMEGEDCGTVAPVVVASGRSGVEVYKAHCFACHETGVSNAPLVAAEEWLARLEEKGLDTLLANTKTGFNVVMPAMGTCMNCSDAELKASIDYLIYGE